MNELLQPSTLSEILDRTAQLYRARFLLFLGIAILPMGVALALGCGIALVVAWWSAAGARSLSPGIGFVLVGLFSIAATLVALPIFLAAKALATAAMNHAASRIHMGETTTIRDAYKTVWRRGWRYIWLYFLQVLFVWGIPISVWITLLALVAVVMKAARMGGITGGVFFGLSVFLVFAALAGNSVWMLLRLSLAFPACVVEKLTAWTALKRSSALSKGTRGRVFLLYLLGAALSWLLSFGVILLLMVLFFMIPGMDSQKHAQAAGLVVGFIIYGCAFAVQTLVKPVYGIALALFYYDQRIRLEGYDIERMMDAAGLNAPVTPASGDGSAVLAEATEAQA